MMIGTDILADFLEKQRKRAEVRKKINKKEKEIKEAKEPKTDLRSGHKDAETQTYDWSKAMGQYHCSEEASVIFITNLFEGEIAQALSKEMPEEEVQKMLAYNKAENVRCYAGMQEQKLDEYIALLEQELQALYAELAAIG